MPTLRYGEGEHYSSTRGGSSCNYLENVGKFILYNYEVEDTNLDVILEMYRGHVIAHNYFRGVMSKV